MPENTLIIYKSSAGSGKTYTLVLEYLKLVLKKPTLYRSILAITFTNKATEEMKSRIITSLMSIADNKEDKLQESISSQTGLPIQELPERAKKVLELILHDYSGFAVSTIDSFFSKIVRALARELHLSMRFDLELDSKAVAIGITDLMFDDLSKNKMLRNWLQEYMITKLEDEKSWVLDAEIHNIARNLFDEKYRRIFPEGSTPPDPEFIASIKKIKSGFENEMREIGKEFFKIIAENNLSVNDFSYKSSGVAGYFIKISGAADSESYIPKDRFLAAVSDASQWVAKKSALAPVIMSLAESSLMKLASRALQLYESKYPRYLGAISVLENAYMAGIIGTLDEKLKQFRAENDVVLISDNNLFLRKAMEGQDAPFIYEKSGNKYTHFMLDEFQDTSDFQWQNLFPLVENALGTGNYTLVVGDAKQSIYRWRGGNMSLLQNVVQENLKAFNENTVVKNLDSNYRSREVIVNFNNRFFEIAPNLINELLSTEQTIHPFQTESLIQKWKKGVEKQGYVKIQFFKDVKADVNTETGEITEKIKWQDSACTETLLTINKLLLQGFSFKDIAILTRANSEAKEITTFLIENGITDIISPESMQLNRSPKILFIINLLTFINDYFNDIALTHVVYYWNIIKKQNNALNLHELFATSRKNKLELLPETFSKHITGFRKMPLFEASEELISLFNLVEEPDAYIQRFSDVIIEYTERHPANIADFLMWWDENQDKETCSVIIPSNVDAVKVMTIHKSKGLQFPVVIMPFTEWNMKSDHRSLIWVSSDEPPFNNVIAHPVKVKQSLELSIFKDDYDHELKLSYIDNLNLLYVAFTRAEEHLYIFSKTPSEKKDEIEVSSTNRLLQKTLQSDSSWSEIFSANENMCFEIGEFTGPLNKNESEKRDIQPLKKWISIPWKDRLRMVVSKNKISSTDPELPDVTYGIHFHSIVSKIIKEENHEELIKNYSSLNKLDGIISTKLTNEIGTFIRFGKEYNWFDTNAETINEMEILLSDGSILRPDRLIVNDKKVIVIDYKTGKEEKYHIKQVQQYTEVLKLMGFTESRMFLVYPGLEKVIEVPAA